MRAILGIGAVVVASVAVLAAAAASLAHRAFRAEFERRARRAKASAGEQPDVLVTEEDLRGFPEPIGRWVRWSGAVGKKRVSSVRLVHGGRFRSGPTRPWLPIRGEYVLTTRKPSFHWYGEMRVAPGVRVVAIDSYLDGQGRMVVKALSLFPIVKTESPETSQSAFGRCVAELSMTPTFFLDRRFVRCEQIGPDSVRCAVADGGFSTEAELHVHPDGALDRIVVMRRFDRGNGRSTLERFTGRSSAPRREGGRMLSSRLDGIWNLPEGDLHYVAFEVESAAFE